MPITHLRTVPRSTRKRITALIEKEQQEIDARELRRAKRLSQIMDLMGGGISSDAASEDASGRLTQARKQMLANSQLANLTHLLPLIFNLNGDPYKLDNHFPFEPFYNTRFSRNMIFKTARQTSKCCPLSDTPVIWRADGSLVSTKGIREGDKVVALTNDHQRVIRRVLAVHNTGVQKIFRIRTRLGSAVEHTAEHRVRTLGGYTAVNELQPGSRIAAARLGGIFSHKPADVSDDRIIFTAYMLGDGQSGTSNGCGFTSACPQAVEEMTKIAKEGQFFSSANYRKKGSKACWLRFRIRKGLLARDWLEADNAWGKYSYEKTIPSWVFGLNKQQTRLFLSRLWATDGCIKAPGTISFTSTSHTLVKQIKSLLAKFGIPCRINQRAAAYKNKEGATVACRDAYTLAVETRPGLRQFFRNLEVPGKPPFALRATKENNNRDTIPIEVQEWIDEVYTKKRSRWLATSLHQEGLRATLEYAPSREKFSRLVKYLEQNCEPSDRLSQLATLERTDVIWDEVVSVEEIEEGPTCDIEVEGEHNYVFDGVYTHNSTNQAVQSILMACLISYFNTLFITPLFELVRRFSSNYVRGFIDQSPVRPLMMDSSCSHGVLQRSFRNQSILHFSYAFTDCDRTRGIDASKVVFDESYTYDTLLNTPAGLRPIWGFSAGDTVYGVDESGSICEDTVVKFSDHGVREVYRIELSNGSALAATSDTMLRTTTGWKRISSIIEDLNTSTNADAARNNAGGREHAGTGDSGRQPELCQQTQLETERIQQGEIHGFVRVRKQTTQKDEERRLGQILQYLADKELPRIAPYRVLVSPQGQETGHPGLVGPNDVGSDSLVVPGRWAPDTAQRGNISHPGEIESRDGLSDPLVNQAGSALSCPGREQPTQRESLLVDLPNRGCHVCSCRENKTVRAHEHGVQDKSSGESDRGSLPLVRSDVSTEPERAEEVRRSDRRSKALLPEPSLLAQAEHREPQALRGGESREAQSSQLGTILCRLGNAERNTPQMGSRVAGEKPRANQCQEESSPQEGCGGETASHSCLCAMPNGVRNREEQEGGGKILLPGMCEGSQATEQYSLSGTKSCEAEIVRITAMGKKPVCDIETEKTHTLIAEGICCTNCQDLDPSFIPIISETMSASKWGVSQYTGTPKTLDNTIEQLWITSSQAEWIIRCPHCKYHNIPSLEHDLDKMLGPTYPDREISEHFPGIVCAKCDKPVNPREGWWEHANPDLRYEFTGYHVPQMILPMHYADAEKWAILQGKRMGFGHTATNVFYNEACGESYDTGAKLVSSTDLKKAATLGENIKEIAVKSLERYTMRVLSIDWGGGGLDEVSFTTAAVLGMLPNGKIECPYGWRSKTPNQPVREAFAVLELMRDFRCAFLVHDFGGAGALRETIINMSGLPEERIRPVAYQRTTVGPMVKWVPFNENTGKRGHHILDKARSLQYTCELIKHQFIRFFAYDFKGPDNPGLLHDFLSLVEDQVDSRMGQSLFTIIRNSVSGPDDFAHAVNMGACTLFHAFDNWPDIAHVVNARIDQEMLNRINPVSTVNWDDV